MMPSNTLSPWFHVIPIILLGIELSPMSHIASFFFFLFSKEQEKHLYFCEFVLIKIKALTSQSMHQPSSPESLSTYSLGSHQYGYTYWLGDDWYQVKHSDLLYAKVKKKSPNTCTMENYANIIEKNQYSILYSNLWPILLEGWLGQTTKIAGLGYGKVFCFFF